METKKILCIHDMSCIGRCSLTVAMPVLASMCIEPVPFPTAVYSMSTVFAGFKHIDLSDFQETILQSWQTLNLNFDSVYTGFLGNTKHTEIIKKILALYKCPAYIDPAFADDGKLYSGFDKQFVESFKGLVAEAKILLPNMTEAMLLTDTPYAPPPYDKSFVQHLLQKLVKMGAEQVLLTGIDFGDAQITVALADNKNTQYFSHPKIQADSFCGTGDLFASIFIGCISNGMDQTTAINKASSLVAQAIQNTSKPDFGVNVYSILKDL